MTYRQCRRRYWWLRLTWWLYITYCGGVGQGWW